MKKEIKQLLALKENSSKEIRLAAEYWKNEYKILFSTILSARTKDETTIKVCEKLFKKYKTVKDLSKAKIRDIENVIKPVNFYKTKAKLILECSKKILKDFSGKIPHDFESLIKLPGVGRKTANVFLTEIGKDSIGVDTHVSYISKILGWTKNSKPERIEQDIKKIFPKKYWKKINPILVRFGKTHISKKEKDFLLKEIKKIK